MRLVSTSFVVSVSLAFLVGCGSNNNPGGQPDANGQAPMFADVACLPDVIGSESVVEGQPVSCTFRVVGLTTASVSLACETAQGGNIDCSSTSATQIQPFGSSPLPIDNGWFGTQSDGLAGTTMVVIWVATDGTNREEYRFEAPVITDDGINQPPTVSFDCAGDTDGTVGVTAGQTLSCTIGFRDADPDSLSWSYQTMGTQPVNDPSPFGGAGDAPFDVAWTWQSDAGESGSTFSYLFTVDDGTAPTQNRNLVVTVN